MGPDKKLDDLVEISNGLTLRDKECLLNMWAKDIMVHVPGVTNNSGELSEENPVCLNGVSIQLNVGPGITEG